MREDPRMSRKAVLTHWNRDGIESMYDKYLLRCEIELIRQRIPPNSKVLDAGCGEAEPCREYSSVAGVQITAVDFSSTRLAKAAANLNGCSNVSLVQADLLDDCDLPEDFDIVISQRFLINLSPWQAQRVVLARLLRRLRHGGRLLLLEGSVQGTETLNRFRAALGLPPIPVKWHNLFLDEQLLVSSVKDLGAALVESDAPGAYYLLTRGIRPYFDSDLDWDSDFNRRAASREAREVLGSIAQLSRLKLWVFRRES